jgi:hypothetical protein
MGVDLSGEYRLLAARWREMKTGPEAKVADWVDHVRGDIVTLPHSEAVRLLVSKNVEPTKSTQKAVDSVADKLGRPGQPTDKNQPQPIGDPDAKTGQSAPVVVNPPGSTTP